MTITFGPQEPPQDYRIWNTRQPDGTFKPLSQFFDEAVRKADEAEQDRLAAQIVADCAPQVDAFLTAVAAAYMDEIGSDSVLPWQIGKDVVLGSKEWFEQTPEVSLP